MKETKQHKKNMKALDEITGNVPERLKEGLMKTVMNIDQEETVRSLIERTDIPLEVREKLQKELDSGDFRFEEDIVDEKTTKELDEYYSREIKKAIKEGKLSKPEDDPFYQKMVKKLDKIRSKQL